MTLIPLRYVHRYADRHGRVRHYLRRPGCKAIALPGQPGEDAFLAAYRSAMADTAPAAPTGRPTVAPGSMDALFTSWYRSAGFTSLRASTQAAYRRIAEGIRAKHGHRLVAQMQDSHVRRMMEAHADHPTAANHLLRILRLVMQHAVAERIRRDDPTRDIARVSYRTDGFAPWSEADIALYEARWPSGTRQRLALALLLYTGQRRSDVVRMGRQHLVGYVDEAGRPRRAIELRQVKTSNTVHIPVLPELEAELTHVPEGQLTFLHTSERGRSAPFTAAGFYNSFTAWAELAGVPPKRSPHGLRKSAGRRLAEGGCTSRQIAAIFGHRTLSEAERYTRDAEQKKLAQAGIVKLRRNEG